MSSSEAEMRKRAEAALEKKAALGEDIDLSKFREGARDIPEVSSLEELPERTREAMLRAGVVPSGEGREGSLVILDNSMVARSVASDAYELMDVRAAMQKHDWLKDYAWKLVQPDADKYTASTYLADAPGYFIRTARQHVKMPIRPACSWAPRTPPRRCTTSSSWRRAPPSGRHRLRVERGRRSHPHGDLGVLRQEGRQADVHMIHNWAEQIGVRPRTGVLVEDNASYINNYVILKKVRTVQTYPTAHLVGRNSVAQFNTVAVAQPGADLDLGSRAVLSGVGSRAEIISRSLTTGGRVVNRGSLVGKAADIKAHLECRGLILGDKGVNIAIPELEAHIPDVEMTHEASLGKIAKDQVEYIMSRGLTEDEAVGMIVRGFLEVGIRNIPEELKAEIDKTIAQAELAKG